MWCKFTRNGKNLKKKICSKFLNMAKIFLNTSTALYLQFYLVGLLLVRAKQLFFELSSARGCLEFVYFDSRRLVLSQNFFSRLREFVYFDSQHSVLSQNFFARLREFVYFDCRRRWKSK